MICGTLKIGGRREGIENMVNRDKKVRDDIPVPPPDILLSVLTMTHLVVYISIFLGFSM